MLWMFQRVFYGEVTNDHNAHMPDLSVREWAIVGPLVAAAIVMGVAPNVFLKPMEPGVGRIVQRMEKHQPMTAQIAPSAPSTPSAPSAP
jgi:NADH-quinone oxidoreductase subunit M